MSAETPSRSDLDARIDRVESAYEFLLAYAAQGRTSDRGTGEVRERLEGLAGALDGLGDVVASCIAEADAQAAEAARPFIDAVAADAAVALGAVRLVLAQPGISSQLIDNLNASIHVRALLTDLFIVDESLGNRGAGPT